MNSLVRDIPTIPVRAEPVLLPRSQKDNSPRRLLGVAYRHMKLAVIVGAAAAAAVAVVFLMTPPTYTATGSVLVDPHRDSLTRTEPTQGGLPPDTSAIDTQVEVLRSRALAEAVVKNLKLYDDPEFNPLLHGRPAAAGAVPSPRAIALSADTLQDRLLVRRAGLTYAIYVSLRAGSPAKAAAIDNTVIDTYLRRQVDEKLAAVDRANRELSVSVEKLRREAESTEAAAQQYKNAHNLFSTAGQTMAEQEVSTLNQQIAQAKADAAEKQARVTAAEAQVKMGSGGADVGAALGSDTIRELRKNEAETSAKLAQLEADFKPGYPAVQRTRAELNDIRAQIQREINRILSSLRADARAAAQREGSLLGSRGAAQGGLAANNAAMVGLVGLQQRADAAKLIYEGYLNRAKDVAAQGSLQQADAYVNAYAAAPTKPSAPSKRLAAVAALLAGLLSGGAAVLIAEMWGRGIKTGDDMEERLGVPFAGIIPDYASSSALRLPRRSAVPDKALQQEPFSAFAEAFRNLGAFFTVSRRGSGGGRLMAMTSALPNEGKSITSLGLARSMALGGAKVAIIDCDLRRRGVTKLIGGAKRGLVEAIEDGIPIDKVMLRDEGSGAWILPASGDGRHGEQAFFSRPEVEATFRKMAEAFDYVILDTPPVLGVADSRLLSVWADEVVFLVQWDKTPWRTAQSAVDILRKLGANVVGSVLIRVDVKAQARYGYSDSSDYIQYYNDYYLPAK